MSDTSFQRLVDELLAAGNNNSLPPVESWSPQLSGDMDIRIARDGTWYHEDTAFERQSLVKLFASILKREGGEYFLVTPVEKWQIQVEDAPLLATRCEVVRKDGEQALIFSTATGDSVVADNEHPIRVVIDTESGEPSPYIEVRQGLEARINRPVYYQLVDLAEEVCIDGELNYVVRSMGIPFTLGG